MADPPDYSDLPYTMPFRFAGLLFLVAMGWFCTFYTVGDNTSAVLMPVFWILLALATLSIVAGAAVNTARRRARERREAGTLKSQAGRV